MATNRELNGKFQTFFHDNVEMNKEETKINARVVRHIVQKILEYVNLLDPKFKKDPAKVGSFHSYSKTSNADEFDFSILYDTGIVHSWTHVNQPAIYTVDANHRISSSEVPLPILQRKYTLKTNDKGPYSVTEGGFIVPLKFKRHFENLVRDAINCLTENSLIDHRVEFEDLSDSPAVTITIKQRDAVDLNVDLAPMVNVRLPFKDEFEWPQHGAQWPSSEKIWQLKNIRVNFVTSDELYWKLSFAICERELLVDIDKKGSGTFRRRSLRIMKGLREILWCPFDEDENLKGLTSYHLKNILFLECERLPMDWQWERKLMGKRIIGMCEQLLKHLSEKNLPQYFDRSNNLFKNKDNGALDHAARMINWVLYSVKEN
ncbi:protein mab-21-like 3 [Mytilus trossulus]|uniref:protein mab-21-like 3 n=1 Tax=Mytilus trossulus TaxID=6551 RepID=UPI0030047792